MSAKKELSKDTRKAVNGSLEVYKRDSDSKNQALSIFSDQKSFETALSMANVLAQSTIVPKDYQKNQGNCLIAIEMAARINTSPMMVMQNLYIVNGRPGWSSQWIIAMINASKKYKTELQFEIGYDDADGGLSCYAWAEDYSGHIVKGPKVTLDMANKEGWASKNGSKWRTMPEVMITYRAASFFGRRNCPDMIMGIYSQDEVIDGFDEEVIGGTVLTYDNETGEVIETEYEEDSPITQEQRQALFAAIRSVFSDSKEANEKLKEMVSEEGYTSTTDLPTSVYNRIMEKISEMSDENDEPSTDGAQEESRE